MILFALEIPDDPVEVTRWLEHHLVGRHLAEVVAELTAVHGGPADPATLQDVLGDHLDAVLEEGLGVLPHRVVHQLLQQPHLLLDLQEQVFIHGDGYWDNVSQPSAHIREQVLRGKKRLDRFMQSQERTPATVPMRPARVAWYRRPMVVALATAAAVLVAVFTYQHYAPTTIEGPQVAQLWTQLPDNGPGQAYLDKVADEAEQWLKKDPQDPRAVAMHLADFRRGCTALIVADHAPLKEDDRRWLVERCRVWADKIDKELVAIEGGQDPEKVRTEANETVEKLIKALRDRAKSA